MAKPGSRSLRKRFGALLKPPPVVTVIRLSGVIGAGGRFGGGLNDAGLAPLIARAAAPGRLAGIALAINSPGGSPVQSVLIAERIRDAARERDVPVFAFCEDVAASGGYLLAIAADEIYAETASIVGSIGVISASFGFHDAIGRIGVERRMITAGANKSRLDPFQPLKPEDETWLRALQTGIHEDFIGRVKTARRGKLDDAPPEVFSGEVYLGEEAVRLGLIDGIGRLRPTLKARFGEDVRIAAVTPRRGLLSGLGRPGMAGGLAAGGEAAEAVASAAAGALWDEAETRAHWARFGL